MMKKCCLWGSPELGTQAGVLALEKHDNCEEAEGEEGTQAGVLALEKHDNCEEAEGEEGEIFLFLNPDGNVAPYASH
ncbi:hypothetical protein Tco_0396158 [Tanacetum coccineum]